MGLLLTVDPILFSEIDPGLDIFRFGFIQNAPGAHDISSVFANDIDQFFTMAFHVIRCPYLENGYRHVAAETHVVAQDLFCLEHIGCIKTGEHFPLWELQKVFQP